MNEKPLERLNYFNGQRLQASDFKLEQDYHMRVRRWLNRSLYTSGIASGLEVYAIKGAPKVRVLPGLAIDHLGREIILLEERVLDVNGTGEREGPYLTIRYQEDVVAREDACCAVGGDSKNKVAWGAPSRILAEPLLEFNDKLPHESSGKIALARVTLAQGCGIVETVDAGIRHYIGEASATSVKQYALEGFRDIDSRNDGVIRFHIRGRQPSAVTLYLRGEQFPSYFYTELGSHIHTFQGQQTATIGEPEPNAFGAHHHTCGTVESDPANPSSKPKVSSALKAHTNDSTHQHSFSACTVDPPGPPEPLGGWKSHAFGIYGEDSGILNDLEVDDVLARVTGTIGGGVHSHHVVGKTNDTALTYGHKHNLTAQGTIAASGASTRADINQYHRQADLGFVADMHVVLVLGGTKVPLTDPVLEQLKNSSSVWENVRLGDGNGDHLFVREGTGPVRIDLLPDVVLAEGEYEIRLIAPATVPRNGGRIHFNLYVE